MDHKAWGPTKKQNLWEQVRPKLVLLGVGAVVTGVTAVISMLAGLVVLKADYAKDEITRVQLLTEFKEGFVRVEGQLKSMDKKIDRMDDKLERIRK